MNQTTTLTLKELILAISQATGLTQIKTAEVINAYNKTIVENLKKDNKVKIYGFGNYSRVHRAAKVGVNPKTQEKMSLPAYYAPKFSFSSTVRTAIK